MSRETSCGSLGIVCANGCGVCVGVQAGEKGCVSEEQKAKALVLCELALALVPSLDHTATLLLYKVGTHTSTTLHMCCRLPRDQTPVVIGFLWWPN